MTEAKLEAWHDETRSFAPSAPSSPNRPTRSPRFMPTPRPIRSRGGAPRPTASPGRRRRPSPSNGTCPFAKWFSDGTLNASYNCVDRHVEAGQGDKVAFHWVADAEGESRTITYAELQKLVAQAANALTELGVKSGDRVAVYMPMIPEAVVTMLAIVRLGAVHSVVFAGFSAEALSSRILDSDCQYVVTADGAFRRGAPRVPSSRPSTRRSSPAPT